MPKILFLPHKVILPEPKIVYAEKGEIILNIALKNNIYIEHACGKSCACTTCHCIIKSGFSSLSKSSDKEEDALDKAWGVTLKSRLSCQAKLGNKDITILIPYYNKNYV
ncbi:ferredoxin [Buchnera aphidicola (Nipponaphis monzeni)]|uniref:2Fe-2S ferredoxin n=1 Tax=Buchnera aphidicola (Nipponaphis monzeni) TaxID=2495405 RepID=A0A455TAU1_9GAMM|nr:ISC system 2Fe-2S type ferredoxin [Buchnera aphidicola]BBI01449.1 ferredoxin [Buchnera aphidicola (Nipponaphis monzeni)]